MKTSPEKFSSHDDEHPDLSALNARSGLALFAVYSTIYLVFVVLSAFAPEAMGAATPLGPNIAILYGFGLIAGAFVLALVYMLLCKRNADRVREGSK
jgi:uncharacterized membrane protein (DUF485 family)